MNWESAVGIAVDRTGHGRLSWLCSEMNPDPESREGYRRLAVSLATGEAPAFPPVSAVVAGLRLVAACPYRSRGPGCGCSGAMCAIRGAVVGHRDCLDCVDKYPL